MVAGAERAAGAVVKTEGIAAAVVAVGSAGTDPGCVGVAAGEVWQEIMSMVIRTSKAGNRWVDLTMVDERIWARTLLM